MASPLARAARLVLGGGFGAAMACNGVLGIEQASLDTGAGTAGTSTGGSGGTTSYPAIDVPEAERCGIPNETCESCLTSECGDFQVQSCLADSNCRQALDWYRKCLGNACSGGEACREQLLFEYEAERSVTQLVGCLSSDAECGGVCDESPLVSMCELYCGCTAQFCEEKFTDHTACMQTCAALDLSVVYCRKMHCEFLSQGNATREDHCDHAVGLRGQCVDPVADDPDCSLVIRGFPCHANEECCSRRCVGQVCG